MSGGEWTVLVGVVAAALALGLWLLVWGGERRGRSQRWMGTDDNPTQPTNVRRLTEYEEHAKREADRRRGGAA